VLFVVGVSIGEITQGPEISGLLPEVSNDLWNPDDPVYVQYLDWLGSLLTLEWGTSVRFGEPVLELFAERAKYTAAYLIRLSVGSPVTFMPRRHASRVPLRRGRPDATGA